MKNTFIPSSIEFKFLLHRSCGQPHPDKAIESELPKLSGTYFMESTEMAATIKLNNAEAKELEALVQRIADRARASLSV